MAEVAAYARPNRLYRFRSLTDATLDQEMAAISGGYVFCPRFDQMNDPMEGGHRVSSLLKESLGYKTTIQAVNGKLGVLGLASFSEVFNHEPMWAHYAGQFSGICIGYSFRRLLASLPDDHELIRMTYSEAPPVLLKNSDPADHRARLILSTKTLRWSPEREWRLIRPSRGEAKYNRIDAVTRVYLGARMNPEHRTAVLSELNRLKIPAYEMQIDQYQIEFKRLLRTSRHRSTR